jgi:hypothetical protein
MRTGKLKVFKEHLDWWEEFRLYHRKDGKVVKERRFTLRRQIRPDVFAPRLDAGTRRQMAAANRISGAWPCLTRFTKSRFKSELRRERSLARWQ